MRGQFWGFLLLSECINWAAIHQRQFSQMDSLDVYVKKKEERRRGLMTPAKPASAAKVCMQETRLHNTAFERGDHLPGKPRTVWKFDGCRGNVRQLTKIGEMSGRKSFLQ